LLALNISKGDEVIIPSYVCTTLYSCVLFTGAVPVVVNVNYSDGNISIDSIKKAMSKKLKLLLFLIFLVHQLKSTLLSILEFL